MLGHGGHDDHPTRGASDPAMYAKRVSEGNSAAALGAEMMSLDDMIKPYNCSDYDPYGQKVTAIQVAMYVKLPKDFGMQISLREFTMGRLMLMFAPSAPVHPVLVTYVSLFDLFYVESLDISISSVSYPIEMYDGTQIPSGIRLVVNPKP